MLTWIDVLKCISAWVGSKSKWVIPLLIPTWYTIFLYKLHKIKLLYMFRASSAHLQEINDVNCTCIVLYCIVLYCILILLWPNNPILEFLYWYQLDTQFFYINYIKLSSSTCFERHPLIFRRSMMLIVHVLYCIVLYCILILLWPNNPILEFLYWYKLDT